MLAPCRLALSWRPYSVHAALPALHPDTAAAFKKVVLRLLSRRRPTQPKVVDVQQLRAALRHKRPIIADKY